MKVIIYLDKRDKKNFEKCREILKSFVMDSPDEMDELMKKKRYSKFADRMPTIVFDAQECKEGFELVVPISLNIAFRMMGLGKMMRKMMEKMLKAEGVQFEKVKVKN